MKKLKKMIMPITMACVMVVGVTSVFASDGKEINKDVSGVVKPFKSQYDVQDSINDINDTLGKDFTPRYQYGKIWFQNNSSKEATVVITKNGTEVTSFTVPANSSDYTYYTFSAGESYSYSIASIDGSVVPVGKIVIKTGETRNEVK